MKSHVMVNVLWLAGVSCLFWLAYNDAVPYELLPADERPRLIIRGCHFPGAQLAVVYCTLAAALPFLAISAIDARLQISPFRLIQVVVTLVAWAAYARWDLMQLGPSGMVRLLADGCQWYAAIVGISVATGCSLR
jgi:hypothetical protein